MIDKTDTTPNKWTGQYFRNDWLNNNPLVASLQGYPYQVRGTDPASSHDALEWVRNGMQSSPATPDGQPTSSNSGSSLNPFGGISDWLDAKGHAIAVGGTGIFVGLVFLVVGLLILLFGTDSGRKVVKAAAAA